MTGSFDEIVTQIKCLMVNKSPVVVAISGFGGSGKSTLTDRLRDHFQIKNEQTIRIDCLYSENPDGPGMLDQVNWPLLKRILVDVHAGKKLQYQGKGSGDEIIQVDEELPELILVEGIRLLQPDLMANFDIAVWINCPQDLALQRAKARDRGQGNDEETVNRWDTDWGQKDKAYFDAYRPDQIATFIYLCTSS